jgi:PncC family amidohydrolase
MDRLEPLAERVAARLAERKETIAVAEGSSGGLIAAALLAVPGASTYFVGGAVVYTAAARAAFVGISLDDMERQGIRPASEPYAVLLAKRVSLQLGTTWGLAEAGAAGPSGNRYGDPAGHTCLAIAGPAQQTFTLRTGGNDRRANMHAFAARALELFAEQIGAT